MFRTLYAVIFDLEGTLALLDGDEAALRRSGAVEAVEFLRQQGIEVPDEFVDKYLEALTFAQRKSALEQEEHLATDTLVFLLQFYGYAHLDLALIQEAVKRTFAPLARAYALDAETKSVLRTLKDLGMRVGILTNTQDDAFTRDVVQRLGLDALVDMVVTSVSTPDRARKPNVEAWAPFWDAWDVLPYEAVMVGDDLVEDILGALNASMWTVWLRRAPAGSELERAIRPDATITRLSDILSIIERWERKGEENSSDAEP